MLRAGGSGESTKDLGTFFTVSAAQHVIQVFEGKRVYLSIEHVGTTRRDGSHWSGGRVPNTIGHSPSNHTTELHRLQLGKERRLSQ